MQVQKLQEFTPHRSRHILLPKQLTGSEDIDARSLIELQALLPQFFVLFCFVLFCFVLFCFVFLLGCIELSVPAHTSGFLSALLYFWNASSLSSSN